MATREDDSPPNPEPPPGKRKWEPPRIQSGQLFEANSLACAKNMGSEIDMCLQGGGQS